MENVINNNALIVGVDIGGSHIGAALVNLRRKCLLTNTHIVKDVNSHASVDEILDKWSNAILEVLKQHPNESARIGIAMPGPFDYETGICYMANVNKYEKLYGLNIKTLLAERLELSPDDIRLRNDAEAFLEGEVMLGAARGFRKALGITLGTGLGTAVSYNGETKDAELGINAPLLDGVAEDYISSLWFIKRYYELTGRSIAGVKELVEIEQDEACLQMIFDDFAKNLTLFLKYFIKRENPDVVVIGGKIANASHLFFNQLKNNLREYTHLVEFRKSWHDEAAPLIGAAFLWKYEVATALAQIAGRY